MKVIKVDTHDLLNQGRYCWFVCNYRSNQVMQTGVVFFSWNTTTSCQFVSIPGNCSCKSKHWFTQLNHGPNLVLDRISKDSALLPALRLAAAEICAVRGQRKLWLKYSDAILTSSQKGNLYEPGPGQKMPWRNLFMAEKLSKTVCSDGNPPKRHPLVK